MQLIQQAVHLHRQGRWAEAETAYRAILAQRPHDFDALHMLGLLKLQQGQLADAAHFVSAAVKRQPKATDAWSNLGAIQARLGRYSEALASFDRVLAINPKDIDALSSRVVVLGQLGRFEEALADHERVMAARPDDAVLWSTRGNLLFKLERLEEASASFEKALALKPDLAEAWSGRGNVLHARMQFDEAHAAYDKALALRPDFPEAWNGRAMLFHALKRYEDALAAFNKALVFKPDFAETWNFMGNLFVDLKRYDEALAAYEKALTFKPDFADAWHSRGNAFLLLKRSDEALACYDEALKINPRITFLAGVHLHTRMDLCDWKGLDQECMQLIVAIREGRAAANPFTFLAFSSSASDQRKSAENCAAYCVSAKRLWRGDRYCHERIRLAYVSADLREHAVSYLLADLFERHDRSRFETFAISLANAPSPMRERLERAFDHFIDVEQKNDEEVAAMLREMEIDIVVDLMGYTRNAHPAIFAMRPAPIQVCYLGYPGTSGADFFDYFIGDKIVLPFDQQPYFTEKIVHLPDCFMPAYSKRAVACEVPARADSGLPEEAFVFCSFNAGYKINAPMFDIWMRLLRDVEGSVLWLLHSNDIATANLRREAQARGVAGHRLIFASPAVLAEHLARISLADLFLNTHPVNAGSNAIDALSVGLPIVTYAGETFVQRVTASLLHAVGLSELVAPSLADYEALALQLARNPAILAQIKAKLARNRETYPLFDIERFTRHLEAAYTTMWEIWQRGEAPKSFAVEPMASSRKGGNTLNGV